MLDKENDARASNMAVEAPSPPVDRKISFSSPSAESEENLDKTKLVKVFLRIRPRPKLTRRNAAKFQLEDSDVTIKPSNDTTVEIVPPEGSQTFRNFEPNSKFNYSYSKVFGQESEQKEIFEETCESLVSGLVDGKDGLLFAYGVTNAGKTYTVEGTRQNPGILPQALDQLFELISRKENLSVKASYLQVYNEQVQDLQKLTGHTKKALDSAKVVLKIVNNNVIAEGLTLTDIESAEDGMKILRKGKKKRTTHETKLNLSSSRSHSVFGLHVVNSMTGKASKLFIVDLAGTERGKRTNPSKERQQEASSINSSLMQLTNCLKAIRQNQRKNKKTNKVVPFRLSKLTFLFRDIFLKANTCGVAMIINCSAMKDDFDETIHSLKYGALVREIKLKEKREQMQIVPVFGKSSANLDVMKVVQYDRNGRQVVSTKKPKPAAKAATLGAPIIAKESVEEPEFDAFMEQKPASMNNCIDLQEMFARQQLDHEIELDHCRNEYDRIIRQNEDFHAKKIRQLQEELFLKAGSEENLQGAQKAFADEEKQMNEEIDQLRAKVKDLEKILQKTQEESMSVEDDGKDDSEQEIVVEDLTSKLQDAKKELQTVMDELKLLKDENDNRLALKDQEIERLKEALKEKDLKSTELIAEKVELNQKLEQRIQVLEHKKENTPAKRKSMEMFDVALEKKPRVDSVSSIKSKKNMITKLGDVFGLSSSKKNAQRTPVLTRAKARRAVKSKLKVHAQV